MDKERQAVEQELLELLRDFPKISIDLIKGKPSRDGDKQEIYHREGYSFKMILFSDEWQGWTSLIDRAREHCNTEIQNMKWQETNPDWVFALDAKIRNLKQGI